MTLGLTDTTSLFNLELEKIESSPRSLTPPDRHQCLVVWTTVPQKDNETRDLSHGGRAIYVKKDLKAKERRFMETQIFHHAKI
jgi:hypothetical protein